jgi:anti-anti-sigma factor
LLCTMPFTHSTVRLTGDLDLFARPSLEQTLSDVDADIVLVDLTGVTFIDAGALGCLVGLKKRLRERARLGIVKIVTPDRRFQRLFHTTGLSRLFNLFESIDDANEDREISEPRAPAAA